MKVGGVVGVTMPSLEESSAKVKERLTNLVTVMEQEFNQSENLAESAVDSEAIANLIEQFEVEHPRITETLNRIMVTLGSMGI